LIQTVTRPAPSGSGTTTTTTTYTYDSLGNVLTVVGAGNNAASQITTTFNYTTDGGYSQSAKVDQPLTITDNLGHTTHMRYDSEGRVISIIDPVGNETNATYNMRKLYCTDLMPLSKHFNLVEGKVYNAGGPAFEADGGSIRFTIKDGRPMELRDNNQ
jgi:YD repeat-containing protein